jgi:hypothetical protein
MVMVAKEVENEKGIRKFLSFHLEKPARYSFNSISFLF